MPLDPAGKWGLRHRLQVAYNLFPDYEYIATQLGVSSIEVFQYINDPNYLPDANTIAQMEANLPDIEINQPLAKTPWTYGQYSVVTYEAPYWGNDTLVNCPEPPSAVRFRFACTADYPPYHPVWSEWYLSSQHTYLDAAHLATNGALENIISIQVNVQG